ncbi:Rhodanese-like domain-containing protein [Suillus plorans]|uniref:Rhodanese-like domain-containing protein n=1 Tax=Suillus plorans TaxID=116603 RepID=A0A9P7E381_9AGAM|nr:Rhodanese-like domain-containing protein [Suillus plorans]KAG1810115.1 Rhodanese-like domain-containing protein [Suillus plorans]
MLRTALFNTTRRAARPTLLARQAARPTYQIFARYESSKANDALKAARKAKDKLQKDWQGPVLTYEQVKPRTLSPSADAYLIDVREPDEVMQGSIPSSVNLPLSVLANSFHLSPQAFKAQHGFEKPGKQQEVVFYCRSGMRSASACDIAKRNGYENILNYEGSWLDWTSREGGKGSTTSS